MFLMVPVCLDVITCFGFGVASLDFFLPNRPLISPTTLPLRGSDPPPRLLSRSFIAVSHAGGSEPLRWEDVLPWREAVGVGLGDAGGLG